MKITIVAVGKLRDKSLKALCQDYRSRLGHHVQVKSRDVRKARGSTTKAVMIEEAENLRAATPEGAVTVALTEEGKQLSSVEVAQKMDRWMVEGRKDVVFYIGGAHGLAPQLKREADQRWSLSRMTFPHDVARMLLWEQLYRAMTIIRGEPYHK
jgi:23S rRNA (pseudouridine1915-N3)-methyltransferase